MLAVNGVLLLVLTLHLLHILSQRSPSNEVLSILPLTFSCLWVYVCVHACTHVYGTHTIMHIWGSEDQSLLSVLFGTVSCWFTTMCTRLPGPQATWISYLHLIKECWDYTYIWPLLTFWPGFRIYKFWSSRLHGMLSWNTKTKSNVSIS